MVARNSSYFLEGELNNFDRIGRTIIAILQVQW